MNQDTDHLTLEQLVAHREWVRRLARTMVRDDAAADDLVQDAYVTALVSPPRREGWRAWMTKVLRNRSRNVHRGESRRALRESTFQAAGHERATADVVAEADAHRHVVDAVMDLDEPLRTTVLLRYFEDLSVEDVARRTESPLETTRSRLGRAREILRSRLDRQHGGREAWCLPLLFTAPPSPEASRRAPHPRVPGGTLATLVGGLIVNKSIALAVLVLVAAGAWYGLQPAGDAPTAVPQRGPGEPTVQHATPTRPRARGEADAAADAASGDSQTGVPSDAAARERSRDGTPLRRITGRVESADGVAVGDARVVWVRPTVTAEVRAAAAGTPPATSAPSPAGPPIPASDSAAWVAAKSDGTFELDVPDSQQPIALLAIATGYAPRREPVALDAHELVIRLRHAVTLRVRLLGRGGRPEAGRWIDVRDEVGSGDSIGRANTDADGFAQFPGLPGGTLVSVRTSGEGRIGGIQQRMLLADAGESLLELRDDGVRRLHVSAVVEGPAVPVSGLLVETSSGPGEIRAWPGGATATIEVPAGAVAVSLVTAAGRGEAVSVAPDADEVALSVRLPSVRWIDVDIGNLDPRTMALAGGRDASELFHAGDLTPFVSGGRLRLPLVEGAEYALRRPDGTERLLGAFTEGRVVLSDPPPRVQVRVTTAAGGALPPGARVVANPVLRAVRMAREEVSGETTTGGDITLALIPGVTYGMLVTAPGVAAARLERRAPADGGEVRVELRAGESLRLRASGIEAGSKTSVVTFPGFARLPTPHTRAADRGQWPLPRLSGPRGTLAGHLGWDMTEAAHPIDPDEMLRHVARLRVLARRLVADDARADDIVQDALVAAIERQRPASAPTGPWLVGVVRNLARRTYRAETRRARHEAASGTRGTPASPDELAARSEVFRDLADEVHRLDPIYRDVVVLHYFDDLAMPEVAARLSVPVETARTRLKRGLAALRERLDRRHGDRRTWVIALFAATGDDGGPGGASSGRAQRAARGGAAAAAAGGVVMATTKTAAVLAAVVLVIGGGVVWLARDDGSSTTSTVAASADVAGDRSARAASRRSAAPDVVEPPPVPPAAPTEADGLLLSGRVVDASGAPVSGAVVSATPVRPVAERGTSPALTTTATSGADGAFDVRVRKDTALADLTAAAAGYATTCVERARPGTAVEIRLPREGVLAGRVLDPAGKPIAGARLRLFRVFGGERLDQSSATTGADGAFRFGGFDTPEYSDKRPGLLDVRAEGFAAAQDFGPFPMAGQELRRDVVLFPARPLLVAVTDADSGAPIGDALVTLGYHATGLSLRESSDDRWMVAHPAPYVAEGRSDSKGQCRLADAPGRLAMYDQLIVRAWKKGFTAEVAVVKARLSTDDERVDVRLWPSATVRGRVVDAAGAGVPGVVVTATELDVAGRTWFAAPFGDLPWGNAAWTVGVVADADGTYVLPCVRASAAGTATAFVWTFGRRQALADGRVYPERVWGRQGQFGVEVRARPGEQSAAPDIVLPAPKPSRSATFVVVDEQDAPIVDARLESRHARGGSARTDAAGRATLRWAAEAELPYYKPEPEPSVSVRVRGYVGTAVTCRPDVNAPPEVRIVLVRGRRLEGRLHEADGRPAAGWYVFAYCRDAPAGGSGARTNLDGSFVIEDLPAAAVEVSVSGATLEPADMRSVRVENVLPGGSPVALVLPADTGRYGVLVATVVDADDGAPLVESHVELAPYAGFARCSRGQPGVTTFERATVGPCVVKASATGWVAASTTATVTEGAATSVRIALARGTPAVVRVSAPVALDIRPGSNRVWAARVDAAPGDAGAGVEVVSTDLGPEGDIRFDALAKGRYRLGYELSANPSKLRTFVSTRFFEIGSPGRTTARASVELVEAGVICGPALDPEIPERGPGVTSSATVEILAVGGERHRVLVDVMRGGWGANVLPGAYVVRLHLPSGRTLDAEGEVRAGETTSVSFEADPTKDR